MRSHGLLDVWLYGRSRRGPLARCSRFCASKCSPSARWRALQQLASHRVPLSALMRLAHIIERGMRGGKKLRRAAAVAFLRLTASEPPACMRLQEAHARCLALALPRRLAIPHVVPKLLSSDTCEGIIREADAYGEAHGWGSLHRRYPTVDLPIACIPGASGVEGLLHSKALPHFARLYGPEYGPPSSLRFRDLFVAKYDAETPRAQVGLDGHVRSPHLRGTGSRVWWVDRLLYCRLMRRCSHWYSS